MGGREERGFFCINVGSLPMHDGTKKVELYCVCEEESEKEGEK